MSRFAAAFSDRLRPTVWLGGRRRPTYGVLVCTGVLLGLLCPAVLASAIDRSPSLALVATATGISTALALAFATRAITGRERFTFYHYQLAILGSAAGVLALVGQPVLTTLDLLAVGLAVAQSVGRLGCLAAGCCHGRPSRWGIRYGRRHAAEGFQRSLIGVPLLPTQAIEALFLATLAATSGVVIALGAPAGAGLTTYLVAYAIGRFLLERQRGDRRPHLAGLSEAQWTSLMVLAGVGLVAASVQVWAALLLLAIVGSADSLRRRSTDRLLDPQHLTEIAARLAQLGRAERQDRRSVPLAVTSRGLRLSTGVVDLGARCRQHVTVSRSSGELSASVAAHLGRWLSSVVGRGGQLEVVAGHGPGVWHLLAPLAGATPADGVERGLRPSRALPAKKERT